jgi:hypothetical protein
MEEMNGREYFDRLHAEMIAEEFGPDVDPATITPVDIRALPPIPGLRLLPFDPAHDSESLPAAGLKRLTAEETAERALKAETFLKRPVVRFPAEED